MPLTNLLAFTSSIILISIYCMLVQIEPWITFVGSLLICRIFKIRDLFSLSIVSLACLGVSYSPFLVRLTGYANTYHYSFSPSRNILIALLVITFCYLLTIALNRWTQSHGLKIFTLYFFFAIGVYVVYCLGLADVSATPFFIAGLIFYGRLLHYISVYIIEGESLGFREFCGRVFPPFWDNSFAPRPYLNISQSPNRQLDLDIRALKVLSLGIFLFTVGKIIYGIAYGNEVFGIAWFSGRSLLPNLVALGYSDKVFSLYSVFEIFLSILVSSLNVIFHFFSIGLLFDGCYLLLGFELPLHLQNVFKARKFSEFFTALMPYYSYYITKVFLYPSYSRLRRLNLRKDLSYSLALAFSIIVGGFLFHLTRDVQFVYEFGPRRFIIRYLVNSIFYFGLLFVFIHYFRIDTNKKSLFSKLIILAVWFVLYSFIFFFRVDFMATLEWEKLHLLFSLFSGQSI